MSTQRVNGVADSQAHAPLRASRGVGNAATLLLIRQMPLRGLRSEGRVTVVTRAAI